MNVLPLKGFRNYFIHSDGYVFRVIGHKEIILRSKLNKSGNPMIRIGSNSYNVVFLLLEYFGNKVYTSSDFNCVSFRFKFTKEGFIPFDKIRVIKTSSKEPEDIKSVVWKCRDKAASANQRVSGMSMISEGDVLASLYRTDFKCFYCARVLNSKTWELDHVQPLSRNGLNIATNIVACCKTCNRMKSTMEIMKFIHKCKFISENFSDSDLLSEESFSKPKLF